MGSYIRNWNSVDIGLGYGLPGCDKMPVSKDVGRVQLANSLDFNDPSVMHLKQFAKFLNYSPYNWVILTVLSNALQKEVSCGNMPVRDQLVVAATAVVPVAAAS